MDGGPRCEPYEDYGARVWRRLAPRLQEVPPSRLRGWLAAALAPRRLATAAATLALMLTAFVAGRYWPGDAPGPAAPVAAGGGERILLIAVGEHLERSEMLLIELANASDGTLELDDELRRAGELLGSNRLYRQAARRSGEDAVAALLEELERLLLDVAHSPAQPPAETVAELRRRIEDGGLLFRVQVVGSQIQTRNQPPRSPARDEV